MVGLAHARSRLNILINIFNYIEAFLGQFVVHRRCLVLYLCSVHCHQTSLWLLGLEERLVAVFHFQKNSIAIHFGALPLE